MTELKAVQEFGEWLDRPDADPPGALRERVVSATRSGATDRSLGRLPRWSVAFAAGLATGVLGTGVAVAILAGAARDGGARDGASPDVPRRAGPASAAPVDGAAETARVLAAAATGVRLRQDPVPRPGQFLYVSVRELDFGDTIRERWLSVDGTADGGVRLTTAGAEPGRVAIVSGCRGGQRAVSYDGNGKPTEFTACTPEPAYRTDLPADADAMFRYLNDTVQRDGHPGNALALFQTAHRWFQDGYIPASATAAIFEAMTRIPGVVARESTDATTGKRVILVRFMPKELEHDSNGAIRFDPVTYAYLGVTRLWVDGAGKVDESPRTVVQRTGFVDRVGQVP